MTAAPELASLATFVSEIRNRPIPEGILDSARRLGLDTIGCAIAGAALPASTIALKTWTSVEARQEATLLPSGMRVPAPAAVYLNAYQTNLLDFDDAYVGAFGGHPAATIVPVALACAERSRASGHEVLLAIVAGYEAAVRIGLAFAGEQDGLPIPSRAWQIFGSTAAAAVLGELTVDQVIHAFALAGMNAPAPFMPKFHEPSGVVGWLKNNSGWIALGGLLAADLAKRGMRGNRCFFDGDATAILGGRSWFPAALSDGLGDTFKIADVSLKSYSACYHIQTTLEALENLRRDHGVDPRKVVGVEVKLVSRLAAERFAFLPQDIMDVPFSIPHLCGLVLAGIPTGYAWFDPAYLKDELVSHLARLVTVTSRGRVTPREPDTASTVTVSLEGGVKRSKTLEHHRGSPAAPLAMVDVVRKFRSLAVPRVGEAGASRIERAVTRLEDLKRVHVWRWLKENSTASARGSSRLQSRVLRARREEIA